MKKHITNFLEYLEIERGLSAITIRNYSFYLNRFADFAAKQGAASAEKITKELVTKYRLWLNRLTDDKGEALKKNTQNYHLIALRGFLKYLVKNDIKTLEPEKIELATQESRQVSFLEGSDLERILAAPFNVEQPAIIQKRDKAILELFFSTGLRVSELTKLKIENINLNKEEFTIRGKGAKLRVVFLSGEAKRWIKEYLEARCDMNPFLFVSHDKAAAGREEQNNLTPRSVQRLIQKYARVAGITKRVTPHTLRHSYATDLLINGADIRSVQAMLGHASITTTQVYTHITDQQLRDVYKAFHGKRRRG
ncbi:tyrosine-type recombinase/integrase [Candidatus Falkowbacteria bacterium]|nr:tyrosine-type recombinase/integrase [Candidatus Falkowbacteria bacterium]